MWYRKIKLCGNDTANIILSYAKLGCLKQRASITSGKQILLEAVPVVKWI